VRKQGEFRKEDASSQSLRTYTISTLFKSVLQGRGKRRVRDVELGGKTKQGCLSFCTVLWFRWRILAVNSMLHDFGLGDA
jgi:hypothetical protein